MTLPLLFSARMKCFFTRTTSFKFYSEKASEKLFIKNKSDTVELKIRFGDKLFEKKTKAIELSSALFACLTKNNISAKNTIMLHENYPEIQISKIVDFEIKPYSNSISNLWLSVGTVQNVFPLKKKMEMTINLISSKPSKSADKNDYYPLSGSSIISFEAELSGKSIQDLNQLSGYIYSISKFVDKWNLYAPLLSICQSSGSGKSKLASSLWSDFNCIYTVFRKPGDTGYPLSNNLSTMFENCANEMFPDEFDTVSPAIKTNIGRYLHLILAILQDYNDNLIRLTNTEKIRNCVSVRKALFDSYYLNKAENSNVTKYFEKYNNPEPDTNLPIIDDVVEMINKESKKIRDCDQVKVHNPIVLIIDEASFLAEQKCRKIDKFRLFRRMTHLLRANSKIVFLTLGTNTDVTDLNPIIGHDSSRYVDKNKLLSPFTLPRTWNVLHSRIDLQRIKMTKEFLSCGAVLWLLFSYGRPLWSSIKFSEIFPTAAFKLKNNSLEQGQSYLAAWLIRTGLTASPTSIVSTKHLFKSLMATLFHITSEHNRVYIGYPSEPVLAITTKTFAEEPEYFGKFLKFVQMQSIDKGRMTESMAAEICLRAISKADPIKLDLVSEPAELDVLLKAKGFLLEPFVSEERRLVVNQPLNNYSFSDGKEVLCNLFYHVTTVKSFIKSLYNTNEFEAFIPECLKTGYVNATHFVPIHRDFQYENVFGKKDSNHPTAHKIGKDCNIVDYALLKNGLLRQCGFVLPNSYYGVDLLLPVCVSDAPHSSASMPCLTYIAIQVKATNPSIKQVISKMVSRHHYVTQSLINKSSNQDSESDNHINWIHSNCLALQIGLETTIQTTKSNKDDKMTETLEIFTNETSIINEQNNEAKTSKVSDLDEVERLKLTEESYRLEQNYSSKLGIDRNQIRNLKYIDAYTEAQIYPCSIYEKKNNYFGVMTMDFRLKKIEQTDRIVLIHSDHLSNFEHLWDPSSTPYIKSILSNESSPLDDIESGPFKLVNTADVANSLMNKSDVSYPFVSDTMLQSKNLSVKPDPGHNSSKLYDFKLELEK